MQSTRPNHRTHRTRRQPDATNPANGLKWQPHIRKSRELTHLQKSIFAEYVGGQSYGEPCSLSDSKMAERLGCSVRAVQYLKADLLKKNLIWTAARYRKNGRGRTSNHTGTVWEHPFWIGCEAKAAAVHVDVLNANHAVDSFQENMKPCYQSQSTLVDAAQGAKVASPDSEPVKEEKAPDPARIVRDANQPPPTDDMVREFMRGISDWCHITLPGLFVFRILSLLLALQVDPGLFLRWLKVGGHKMEREIHPFCLWRAMILRASKKKELRLATPYPARNRADDRSPPGARDAQSFADARDACGGRGWEFSISPGEIFPPGGR